jgi:hypothetical protein
MASPEVHEAPAPRGQGLYLSADLGLDGLVAHWRELALDRPVNETSVGFVLGGRIGVEIVPGVAAFLDARLRAPIVVPVFGLYAAEAGIGGIAILVSTRRGRGPRRNKSAWARYSTALGEICAVDALLFRLRGRVLAMTGDFACRHARKSGCATPRACCVARSSGCSCSLCAVDFESGQDRHSWLSWQRRPAP